MPACPSASQSMAVARHSGPPVAFGIGAHLRHSCLTYIPDPMKRPNVVDSATDAKTRKPFPVDSRRNENDYSAPNPQENEQSDSEAKPNCKRRRSKRRRGKWSNPKVPQKGWTCSDFEDLGAPEEVCGMCEIQLIRYVHYMTHPEYEEVIGAGRVCAGAMEQDEAEAVNRQNIMYNTAKRRKNWLRRKWNKTSNGGQYTSTRDGYNIVAHPSIEDNFSE